jgi:Na+/phosphate symporter
LLDEIKLMLRTVWMMIWGKNVRLVSKVEEHQRRIEGTQEELKDYLSQISDENLSEEDVDWKFIVLDYSQELTAIGTLIRRDLCDADSPDSVESGTITGGQRGTGSFLCSNT